IGSGATAVSARLQEKGSQTNILSTDACAPISAIAALAEQRQASSAKPRPLYLRAPDAKPQRPALDRLEAPG
ncbi:MAG: hypothetical protein AAFW47_02780, partial [Pseudomonadota bacterium]